MNSTTTPKAPVVSLDTPVSIRIGSDQYEARVVKVTAATVAVQMRGNTDSLTFRPYVSTARMVGGELAPGGWSSGNYYLVIGESVTRLDPSF